jgi:hypothetical protein
MKLMLMIRIVRAPLESPPTLDKLFENTKMFIAPHLYGAGIQYKVSAISKYL